MTNIPRSPYPRKLYFGEFKKVTMLKIINVKDKNTIKKREKKEEPVYIKPFKNV